MSITFNDLLADPKYREMEYQEFHDLWHSDHISQQTVDYIYKKLGKPKGLMSHECWLHLQKLKAEPEKKAEPNMVFKDYEKVFDMFFKPIKKPVTFTPTEPKATEVELLASGAKSYNQILADRLGTIPIFEPKPKIVISRDLLKPNYSDESRKEIIAKLNDCNPNEIKII